MGFEISGRPWLSPVVVFTLFLRRRLHVVKGSVYVKVNCHAKVIIMFKIECPKIPLCVICVHSYTNIL